MTSPDCPDPEMCPVGDPGRFVKRFRTIVVDADTRWWRGVKLQRAADEAVPGVGDTRFAPLVGRHHLYLAATRTAAVIESALHDVRPRGGVLFAGLATWKTSPVRIDNSIRVVDWRDSELDRLGMAREALVATTPAHYACTRQWAQKASELHRAGEPVHGAIWNSRQVELHAAADTGGVVADLFVERSAEVLVIWTDPGSPPAVHPDGEEESLVDDSQPTRFTVDLLAFLGIRPLGS